jgi:hypothetical protein
MAVGVLRIWIHMGGWVASVADLLRFVDAIDGRRGDLLLSKETVKRMIAKPDPYPMNLPQAQWYGMGWHVRNDGTDQNWWHDGSLDGTKTILVRANNQINLS